MDKNYRTGLIAEIYRRLTGATIKELRIIRAIVTTMVEEEGSPGERDILHLLTEATPKQMELICRFSRGLIHGPVKRK